LAKLYYRYGVVGSAKTLNLLAVAHSYRAQGKKVLLVKPAQDTRFGKNHIRSRAGLETEADLLVDKKSDLLSLNFKGIDCLLIDEVQFIAPEVIDQLRVITIEENIPVICYGLRNDFKNTLFPGSRRLMEIADSIEEVKSICHFCKKKAVMNIRHVDGKPTLTGAQVELGAEEKYFPACAPCFYAQHQRAGNLPAYDTTLATV
jgi:thymidine kinase